MDQFKQMGPIVALIKLWNELTSSQRVVVTTFALLSVITLIFAATSLTKPKMDVLFSGLSQEDAGAIAQKLDEAKVVNEPSSDGTTIRVPSEKVAELRLQMAASDLPSGNAGFRDLNKSTFGQTEFMEKVNYQHALEGELTRTVCSYSAVSNARIHITVPGDNVFVSEEEPAKAAVWLKLKTGEPFGDEQVGAVVHLVSSSIKGLSPENVTVTDSDGNVLSEGPSMKPGSSLVNSAHAKQKRQVEEEITKNVQKILNKVVGPDKGTVSVIADMVFDQTDTEKESWLPATPAGTTIGPNGEKITTDAKGILINEEKKSEAYNGPLTNMGGNVPASVSANSGSNDKYTRDDSTRIYGVNKTIEHTTKAPGTIKRLSVSVLVDDKVPAATLGVLKEAVRAAAGIDETGRKDILYVDRAKFSDTTKLQIEQEMAAESKNAMIMVIAKNAGAVIMLVLFLVFLKRIIKQIKVPVTARAPAAAPRPAPVAGAYNQADLLAAMNSSQKTEAQPQQKEPQQPYIKQEQEPVPPEIAESNPEELARLVRTWMTEQ
ncbi:MAG: flagellar basal-body MS-ring/collar protein FliF [Armatimonadetes bacterium]|nr:flagellar basal-body MS-ring/collar protein FliF [Armatimonadota bacterium]